MEMPLSETLVGHWTLSRAIDQSSQPSARARGKACFSIVSEKCLHLNEYGLLLLADNPPIAFSNAYLLHTFAKNKNRLDILFPDERLFHRLNFETENGVEKAFVASATHLCGRDTYDSQYRFCENKLSIVHRVTGPKKELPIANRISAA